MPKGSKKSRRVTKTRGAVPQWPVPNRLAYHLAEIAMHIRMVEQILKDEDQLTNEMGEHINQLGKRALVIYRLCRRIYPEMHKQ
jgi:hypothetical protein